MLCTEVIDLLNMNSKSYKAHKAESSIIFTKTVSTLSQQQRQVKHLTLCSVNHKWLMLAGRKGKSWTIIYLKTRYYSSTVISERFTKTY